MLYMKQACLGLALLLMALLHMLDLTALLSGANTLPGILQRSHVRHMQAVHLLSAATIQRDPRHRRATMVLHRRLAHALEYLWQPTSPSRVNVVDHHVHSTKLGGSHQSNHQYESGTLMGMKCWKWKDPRHLHHSEHTRPTSIRKWMESLTR